MREIQLSVRSRKARELAHRLARRENTTIVDIVERALEAYEVRETAREPAEAFFARLTQEFGTDIDLQVVIDENRREDLGIDL